MPTTVIDANLLILLVVGAADKSQIGSIKGTREFDLDCFNLLKNLLGNDRLVVTPNVMTETSNILDWTKREPLRSQIIFAYRYLANNYLESYVISKDACSRPEFDTIGLSDTVLVVLGNQGWRLITADGDLWAVAKKSGIDVINFNHERDARGLQPNPLPRR